MFIVSYTIPMKIKKLILTYTTFVLLLLTSVNAYAGVWRQDETKPANNNGVTNWRWINDDGSCLAGLWAWIDGNGDGIAECYYFSNDGYLMAGTTINDGTGSYTVNDGGAWLENGVKRVYPTNWLPDGMVQTASIIRSRQTIVMLNPLGSGYSDDNATRSALSDAECYLKLMQIKAEFPEGTSWNDDRQYISGNRCGYGCAAFIFMVQDRLYGTPAKPRTVYTLDMAEIRVGDHLRVRNNEHSVIVLANNGNSVTVCEGNYNNVVHWGRVITADELSREFVYRETCY